MIHKVAPLSRRYFGGSSPDGAAIIRHSQGMGMVHGRPGARSEALRDLFVYVRGTWRQLRHIVSCRMLAPPTTSNGTTARSGTADFDPHDSEDQSMIFISAPESGVSLAIGIYTMLPVTRRSSCRRHFSTFSVHFPKTFKTTSLFALVSWPGLL